MLEADNVVVVQGAMNFNLGHELCFCSALGETAFHDDLGSLHLFVFKVSNFVTLGEASLSEELAFEVLLDDVVAVELDDAFFNDGLSVLLGRHSTLASVCLGCHIVNF